MSFRLPRFLRSILVVLWPLAVTAVLTELGYRFAWNWSSSLVSLIIWAVTLCVGAVCLFCDLGKGYPQRPFWILLYVISGVLVIPLVSLMIAGYHGDVP